MQSTNPPGTVSLVEFEPSADGTNLMLVPLPSSDPNEPLNWSKWRKWWNYTLILGMSIVAFTFVTVQIIYWQQIGPELKLDLPQLNSGNSAQLAGLAVGCIFFVPFAVKYGRRPVYLASIALMAAMCWWTSRMNSYAEFVISNFITGISSSVNETTVQMTIADLFFVHQRGTANGLYFVAVMIGSFLTPMAGGAQAATQGWRWSYYSMSIVLTILLVIFAVSFEETKYIPLTSGTRPNAGTDNGEALKTASVDGEDDKADGAKLDLAKVTTIGDVPTPALNSYKDRMRMKTTTSESLLRVAIAPAKVILFPHVLYTALQFASGVCWLVLLLTMTSQIFSAPPYLFDTAGVGYMALGPFIGNVFGALYGGPLSDWSIKRFAKRNGGIFEPEMRLWLLLPPCLFQAGGLAMFGVTAGKGMHWIYPSVGGAFFAFGFGATGDISFTFVIDSYHDLVAEAFVGIAFLRNAVSIIIPLTSTQWISQVGVVYMFVTASMICLFVCLLFIPMIIWGKRIRTAMAPRYHQVVEKRLRHGISGGL